MSEDVDRWMEENTFYCSFKKARLTDKQCSYEMAKSTYLSMGQCRECAKFVYPSQEERDKVKFVKFNRMDFGRGKKRKSVSGTPSKQRVIS